MLQIASMMPATKSKKEVRALGAMERLFWLMDQKHPAHLTVTAEVKGLTKVQGWRVALDALIQMDDIGPIPASAVVVSKAPQIELLKRAELCFTHAGINTTFESLALGVPMVAIPVGFDQPGIAARIVYHGVGESVPVASMNKADLSGAIQEVLGNPSYRETTRRFQRTIAQTHGLDRAADVLERAFN